MISPLRTCFKRGLFSLLLFSSMASAAAVTGQVILIAGHEAGQHPSEPATTVVWLSPLETAGAPGPGAEPAARVKMTQKNKHFNPHILAVEVGTLVDFPNLDPIFHNAFSNFDGQLFDIGLYPPGSSRSIRFRREGLVRVFCNIHPAMSAVIVVLATPYFTVTGEDGRFTIPNVPPGQYKLRLFHERATPETLDGLAQTIAVSNSPAALGELRISEAGYIPTPHKNKYGRDYPADPEAIYH